MNMIELRKKAIKRFWKKVNKTEVCWLWIGAVNWAGYGRFQPEVANTEIVAHRFSYALVFGNEFLSRYYDIHHKCKNKNCVNPDHLIAISGYDHRRLEGKKRKLKNLERRLKVVGLKLNILGEIAENETNLS